jgi:hypothetical protein
MAVAHAGVGASGGARSRSRSAGSVAVVAARRCTVSAIDIRVGKRAQIVIPTKGCGGVRACATAILIADVADLADLADQGCLLRSP